MNLIIDGNYLLNRLVFALSKADAISQLKTSLLNNIKYWNNQFNWNQVFLVSDGKNSWRRDIYADYKSNKKDSTLDWNEIFKFYNEFKIELSKTFKHIKQFENDKIEGDDWIGVLCDYSNANKHNVVILTADCDMMQKIKCDWNTMTINLIIKENSMNQKLYVSNGYEVFLERYLASSNDDIFDAYGNNHIYDFIYKLIKKYPIDVINSEAKFFTKLVSGDKSDTIPSIYRKTGKTGKVSGIGETGAIKIYELYKTYYADDIDFNSESFVTNLVNTVSIEKKIIDSAIQDEIKSNIELNLNLISLDKIPTHILEIINNKL